MSSTSRVNHRKKVMTRYNDVSKHYVAFQNQGEEHRQIDHRLQPDASFHFFPLSFADIMKLHNLRFIAISRRYGLYTYCPSVNHSYLLTWNLRNVDRSRDGREESRKI